MSRKIKVKITEGETLFALSWTVDYDSSELLSIHLSVDTAKAAAVTAAKTIYPGVHLKWREYAPPLGSPITLARLSGAQYVIEHIKVQA